MKNLFSSLKEHAANITNFERKKILPLAKKELKLHEDAAVCVTFAEKHSQSSLLKIKIIEKLGTIAILQVDTEVQLIVYVTYKIILIIKETNSEPSEISETKISTKIVNG